MKKRILTIALCAVLVLASACSKAAPAYKKGSVNGAHFESEYLNLQFTAPEGYTMQTEEQLLEFIDFGAEFIDGIDVNLDYTKATTVDEMVVSEPAGLPNLSLMVEKLPLSSMTEEAYIKQLKEMLPQASSSMTFTFADELTTVEIAGKSYQKLSVVTEAYGMEMLQDYLFHKSGNRMIGFIVTYSAETTQEMQDLLDLFASLA